MNREGLHAPESCPVCGSITYYVFFVIQTGSDRKFFVKECTVCREMFEVTLEDTEIIVKQLP